MPRSRPRRATYLNVDADSSLETMGPIDDNQSDKTFSSYSPSFHALLFHLPPFNWSLLGPPPSPDPPSSVPPLSFFSYFFSARTSFVFLSDSSFSFSSYFPRSILFVFLALLAFSPAFPTSLLLVVISDRTFQRNNYDETQTNEKLTAFNEVY